VLKRRLSIGCAIALTSALAYPQTGNDDSTHRLAVTLDSNECAKAKNKFFVIVDGDDSDPVPVDRLDPRLCRWTGSRNTRPFSTNTTFSARFRNGARSECRHASARYDRGYEIEPLAELAFHYEPKSAQDVVITLEPPTLYVRYVRDVDKDDRFHGSIPCREQVPFSKGKKEPSDVRFSLETLHLYLMWGKRSEDSIDFIVDSLLQHQMDAELKKGKGKVLGHNEIVDAVVRKNLSAPTTAPPDISCPEIDFITRNLAEAQRRKVGVESVTLRSSQ